MTLGPAQGQPEQRRGLTERWPLAVAIALHLLLAIWIAPRFEFDSQFYRVQAENIAAGFGSLDVNGEPETRYPPGYPLFLAMFLTTGAGYTGAMAVQHVLWVIVTMGAMWVVRHASGSTAAAVTAGAITALDLPALHSSISVLSETLAAAAVLAAVTATWLAITAKHAGSAFRWALVAGLCAGVTVLVRPIAILLGVALALPILYGADPRWRVRSAVVLMAAFAVLPAWWIARNARETGVPTLSSLAGINLLHYRAAATLAINDPGGIDVNLPRRRDELERAACRELETIYQRPCGAISWAERSGTYSRLALPVILGDPVASARLTARALAMIVFGGGASLLSELTGLSERAARLVCLAYTVPLALLAMAGFPYWWRRNRAFASLLFCVIAYMFGMSLGAEAYSRFRVPVIALYGMLSGGGVALLRERLTS